MKISVVCPLYNSAQYILELYKRIDDVLTSENDKYEIVFVIDGSPDNSLGVALQLFSEKKNIVLVELSRNFGQHKALMTGLEYTSGDLIFIMDADLEESPENIQFFMNEYINDPSFDVIYGVQVDRKGGWVERKSGELFYSMFARVSGLGDSKESPTPFRLMTRKYVDAILRYSETEFFFHGVSKHVGFKQKPFTITKCNSSKTTYTFRKKVSLFINSITSFSNKPLIFIFYLGLLVSTLSFFFIFFFILRYFLYGTALEGWNSIFISVWMLGGLIIFCMGIIGVYLSKVFLEVKNRPFTIVKNVYKK